MRNKAVRISPLQFLLQIIPVKQKTCLRSKQDVLSGTITVPC